MKCTRRTSTLEYNFRNTTVKHPQCRAWYAVEFRALWQVRLSPVCLSRPNLLPMSGPVVRECLFKAARIRTAARYNKSHKDRPTVKQFLAVELTAPIFELARHGFAQGAAGHGFFADREPQPRVPGWQQAAP